MFMNRRLGTAVLAACAVMMPMAGLAQSKATTTVVNPVSNPVNTRITNAVVPVEISNADAIPVQTAPVETTLANFRAHTSTFSTVTSNGNIAILTMNEATHLTGVTLQINVDGSSGTCVMTLAVVNANDAFVTPIASMAVRAGQSLSSPAISFQNLAIPAGYKFALYWANETGAFCRANTTIYMSRA